MIRFVCPHCGKGLRTDDENAGAAFNCPGCRGRVCVPEVSVEVADAARPSPADHERSRFTVRHTQRQSGFATRSVRLLALVAAIGGAGAGVLIGQWFAMENLWLVAAAMALAAAGAAGIIGGLSLGGLFCPRCRRRKSSRSLGSIERDAQSAKEALEAGDLAALRALSPEGDTIFIAVAYCRRCGADVPIDVRFSTRAAATQAEQELALVSYPGRALPIFERLCQRD